MAFIRLEPLLTNELHFCYADIFALSEGAGFDRVEYSIQFFRKNCDEMLLAAKQKYKAVGCLAVFGGMSEVQTDFFKDKKSGSDSDRPPAPGRCGIIMMIMMP